MSGPILLSKASLWRNGLPVFLTTAERDLLIPNPRTGEACYVSDGTSVEGLQIFTVGRWRPVSWNAPWGELGYGAGTAAQNGITTIVDVTGATATWVHQGNRKYRYTAQLPLAFQNTAAATTVLTIADGSNVAIFTVSWKMAISQFNPIMIVNREIIGAAATITRKARLSTNAGTIDLAGAAATPNFLLVEDIGPSGAPI